MGVPSNDNPFRPPKSCALFWGIINSQLWYYLWNYFVYPEQEYEQLSLFSQGVNIKNLENLLSIPLLHEFFFTTTLNCAQNPITWCVSRHIWIITTSTLHVTGVFAKKIIWSLTHFIMWFIEEKHSNILFNIDTCPKIKAHGDSTLGETGGNKSAQFCSALKGQFT